MSAITTTPPVGITHNEAKCRCEASLKYLGERGTLADLPPEDACSCQCRRCFDARARLVRHAAALALMKRLDDAKIDVGVLSSLIWSNLESYLEPLVERMAQEKVAELLNDVVLISRVRRQDRRVS